VHARGRSPSPSVKSYVSKVERSMRDSRPVPVFLPHDLLSKFEAVFESRQPRAGVHRFCSSLMLSDLRARGESRNMKTCSRPIQPDCSRNELRIQEKGPQTRTPIGGVLNRLGCPLSPKTKSTESTKFTVFPEVTGFTEFTEFAEFTDFPESLFHLIPLSKSPYPPPTTAPPPPSSARASHRFPAPCAPPFAALLSSR
jgi:hypothetical protein